MDAVFVDFNRTPDNQVGLEKERKAPSTWPKNIGQTDQKTIV